MGGGERKCHVIYFLGGGQLSKGQDQIDLLIQLLCTVVMLSNVKCAI